MNDTSPPRPDGASPAGMVRQLLADVDAIAPLRYAAEWDNVGLLAGARDWPARSVLLTLDLTDAVAREALEKSANVVVAYHPLIFKGIRSVTDAADCPTCLLPELLANRVSIIAVHTAMDAAVGGTNDILLDCFETASRRPLQPLVRESHYKLVAFVPPAHEDALRRALWQAGAGVIGQYDQCSFSTRGEGTFRGDESTTPTIGQAGKPERAEESRLEVIVPRAKLGRIVNALYEAHPYEEPAFDVYPVQVPVGSRGDGAGQKASQRPIPGMGRIGTLAKPATGRELLALLGARVDLSIAQVAGDLSRRFSAVIAAAGSYGVDGFDDPEALVLTGEFKHHDALKLVRRGVTAVALGHYASERPVLAVLAKRLSTRGWHATIAVADRSPFQCVQVG